MDAIQARTEGKQIRAFSPRKPKRVEMTAAECKKLCAAVGLDYLEGYEGRVVEHVITDETVDRYGDIVRAKGVDITNFKKNPTIQFAHDYKSPPVGKAIKVWLDKDEVNVKAWGLYFDQRVDETGRSGVVFNFISSGAMPACSIGFLPTEVHRPKNAEERDELGLGDGGLEYRRWELLEYSPCPVPANPNALQNALEGMPRKDMEVIRDNEEGFRNVLPDEWVDEVLVALADGTDPDAPVEKEDNGLGDFVAVVAGLVDEIRTLKEEISALKNTFADAASIKATPSGEQPGEAQGNDIYTEFAGVVGEVFGK